MYNLLLHKKSKVVTSQGKTQPTSLPRCVGDPINPNCFQLIFASSIGFLALSTNWYEQSRISSIRILMMPQTTTTKNQINTSKRCYYIKHQFQELSNLSKHCNTLELFICNVKRHAPVSRPQSVVDNWLQHWQAKTSLATSCLRNKAKNKRGCKHDCSQCKFMH